MAYNITYDHRPGYLHVTMEGEESYAAAIQFWDALAIKMKAEKHLSFMIHDLVEGALSMSDHYYISTKVAELFSGKVIAYIDPKKDTFSNNVFGGTVVSNRGVRARVFSNEAEAESWLLKQIPE